MIDEYDIMNERFCSYKEAQEILKEMQAKEVEEALLRAEQDPPFQEVVDTLERRHAAQTLLRLGATNDMLLEGVYAYNDYAARNYTDIVKDVWEAMLKEAAK